jgi:nucleoside-diphosphate-sugar epimerase
VPSDLTATIYVAGHRGMVGSAIVRRLQALGYQNIVTATHAELEMECNVIGAAHAAAPVVHRTGSRID